MAVSEAYVSLLDLPDTISDVMKFDASFGHESALNDGVNEKRIRRFFFYEFQKNEWEAEYTDTILEFMIQGSHYESEWIIRSFHGRP